MTIGEKDVVESALGRERRQGKMRLPTRKATIYIHREG
jgi:hypothetical protein